MPNNSNVCGQRIDYELPVSDRAHGVQADIYREAYRDIEDALSIITEIQNKRTNEDGKITEPLTSSEVGTILEVGVPLERSLTILEALEEGPMEGL